MAAATVLSPLRQLKERLLLCLFNLSFAGFFSGTSTRKMNKTAEEAAEQPRPAQNAQKSGRLETLVFAHSLSTV